MTRFVYVLPAGRFRWEVRVDSDALIEAGAEQLRELWGWAEIERPDTSEARSAWERADNYARAVIRAAMPGNSHSQHYRRKAHALIAARAIALIIGGEVQPHDRRGRIQDPDSYGGDSPRRRG